MTPMIHYLKKSNELMMFTDSDWATSVDTRCSHGCYVIMFAGAAIAHTSEKYTRYTVVS